MSEPVELYKVHYVRKTGGESVHYEGTNKLLIDLLRAQLESETVRINRDWFNYMLVSLHLKKDTDVLNRVKSFTVYKMVDGYWQEVKLGYQPPEVWLEDA